jgi:hypothetical protein
MSHVPPRGKAPLQPSTQREGGVMSVETWQGHHRMNNGMVEHRYPQPNPQPPNVVALMEWAQAARAAHDVAESLVQSSFVPLAFRGKPHEATAAILAGLEIGLNPMAALRAFDVIQNTAAPKAITLRAIVQSRGHEVWVHESTSTRAIVKGRRAGSDRVQESVWNMDRARGLGLTSKDNWKRQPGAMLVARATSEICRLIASDAILGLPYASEELADDMNPDGSAETEATALATPEAQPQPVRRTAQRRTQPQRAPAPAVSTPMRREPVEPDPPNGPPLPGEEADDAPTDDPLTGAEAQIVGRERRSSRGLTHDDASQLPDRGTDPVTKAQLTKLHTIFSNAGIDNRDTRLRACELLLGIEVDSSRDLTKEQASVLIDCLETEGAEGDLAEFITELIGRADDADAEATP